MARNMKFNNLSINYDLLIYNFNTSAWEFNLKFNNSDLINDLLDNVLNLWVIETLHCKCYEENDFNEKDVVEIFVSVDLDDMTEEKNWTYYKRISLYVYLENYDDMRLYELFYNSNSLNNTLYSIQRLQLAGLEN